MYVAEIVREQRVVVVPVSVELDVWISVYVAVTTLVCVLLVKRAGNVCRA